MFIAAIYRGLASKRFTGIITNLGLITLPGEMSELINSFEFIAPPPNPKIKVTSALVSFKGKLMISFSNISKSRELERRIFRHLSGAGIHVRILKNV